MSYRRIALLGLLLLVVTSTQIHAEIIGEQKYQQWTSGIVSIGEDIRFRAFTGHAEASSFVVLAFDRIPQNCLLQHVSINIVLPKPHNSDYDPKHRFGALRVDEALMHNITYTLGPAIGPQLANQAVIITLQNFDKETTILQELQRGKNIRIKLDDDFYLRFSLSGFTNASRHSLQLCMEGTKENSDKNYSNDSDKNYFDHRVRVKKDNDYFRY